MDLFEIVDQEIFDLLTRNFVQPENFHNCNMLSFHSQFSFDQENKPSKFFETYLSWSEQSRG